MAGATPTSAISPMPLAPNNAVGTIPRSSAGTS